ncbi:response regulator [Candidatus Saccharibacteria bacterium]|nr:response regulator [Candidatus Saccharibacteria bacterium]
MTKIMLVEDDKSLREIYGIRLIAEGYEIKSAGDGEEALALIIKERPDLVISDVMMPKISGFDMLDILRATPETKDIKIIMMTALSSEDQRARGESLGADRYLVKSQVGIEDVVRTVHEVLGDAPVAAKPAEPAFSSPFAAPTAAQPKPAASPIASPVATNNNPTMPQPTAPFSSAAPASLGEDALKQPAIQPMAPAQVTTETAPTPAPVVAPASQPIAPAQPVIVNTPATPSPYEPAGPAPVTTPEPTPAAPAPALETTAPVAAPIAPEDIAAQIARELGSVQPDNTAQPQA